LRFFVSPFDFLCSPFCGMDAVAPSPPTPLPLRGRGEDWVYFAAGSAQQELRPPEAGGEGRTFRGAKRDNQISNSRAGLRPAQLLRKTQEAQNRRRQETQESHQSNRGQSTRVQRLRAARVRIAEEGLGKKTTPTPNEIRSRSDGSPECWRRGAHNERGAARRSRSRHATREKTRSLALADP
jgi:hypothetical protein